MAEKYSIEHKTVENILGYIRSEEIAIPEIQRPFVWSGAQVRDLIDSLYKGYPAGYLTYNRQLKLSDLMMPQYIRVISAISSFTQRVKEE